MKKSFKIIAGLAFAGTVLFSSCNKTKDEVTPVDVTKPVAKVEFTDGTNGTFSVPTVTVSTTGDSAYISLEVNATTTKSTRIYMMLSEDNGVATGVAYPHKLVGKKYDGTGANYDFDQKSGYTFEIPSGVGNAYKLNVPVKLRGASAKSDVYTIWITNGAGDFTNPGKNRVFGGNAIVTFKYAEGSLINNYATTLGNTKNADLGSLFATIDGTNYFRDSADNVDAREKSVDFAYVTPNSTDFIFGSLKDAAVELKFTLTDWDVANRNDTKFSTTTVSELEFNAIDGETALLAKIPSSITATSVKYTSAPTNVVFAFQTVGGKKGLVLVKSATGDVNVSGTASVQVKVQR
jgi:hypothetical protein